jgi:hypothetical protein
MSEIALFSGKVPSFLAKFGAVDASDLTANIGGGGFPVMSIKGKTFTLVKSGDREILMNPNDPEEIATSINVVVLKANGGLSKIWYAKAFVEGTDAKPDCFSNDGITPDSMVTAPVSKKCAICPKNEWGSKISDDGKKFKACSDSRRVAIARPDALDDPIMLRVPAGSLRNLADFGADLAKRGIPYSAVIAKVGFDREVASPKLTFRAIEGLSEAEFNQVQEAISGETVRNILGVSGQHAVVDGEDTDAEVATAKVEAPAPAKVTPAAKPKAAVKAAPVPAAEAEEVPEPTPVKAAPKAVKVVEATSSLEDELDDLLGDM